MRKYYLFGKKKNLFEKGNFDEFLVNFYEF